MKLLLKWLINGVIVVWMLMYYSDDVGFWSAAFTATLLSLIAYVVGDQLILRKTNNIIATISDALLAFIVLWTAGKFMGWNITIGEVFGITFILGIAEFFIHRYIFKDKAKAKVY